MHLLLKTSERCVATRLVCQVPKSNVQFHMSAVMKDVSFVPHEMLGSAVTTVAETRVMNWTSGCPVGQAYPWVYVVPPVLSRNLTYPGEPPGTAMVVLTTLFYVPVLILALVSSTV